MSVPLYAQGKPSLPLSPMEIRSPVAQGKWHTLQKSRTFTCQSVWYLGQEGVTGSCCHASKFPAVPILGQWTSPLGGAWPDELMDENVGKRCFMRIFWLLWSPVIREPTEVQCFTKCSQLRSTWFIFLNIIMTRMFLFYTSKSIKSLSETSDSLITPSQLLLRSMRN